MRSIIQRFFYLLGLKVERVKKSAKNRFVLDGYSFDTVLPPANYAPWLKDNDFTEIYASIQGYTLVDIYRCFELWELAERVYNLNPTAGFIEIGVWRGGTAAIVGKKLSLKGSNAPFYLADTFKGVVKATEKDAVYTGGEHADTSADLVKGLLKNNYQHIKILEGIFPDDTGHLIPGSQQFGYCHIDVDVYQSAKEIVDWIWDRLIPGGVIVFDDYGFSTCTGIIRYVNEQKSKGDRLVLHNLNGHAIIVKVR
jgi:O-methyltransferase